MLWRTSSLGDHGLEAKDGAIGAVRDCLFDDTHWTVRWFVVDTGTWLPGRKVLLAAGEVVPTDDEPPVLSLGITKEQVRESPPLEADAPVSRRYEERLVSHYGWPDYWMGLGRPSEPVPSGVAELDENETHVDVHLRSTIEMTGYHIRAKDGAIGHVDDFLLDPAGWKVRYIVVDTRDWWPGKQVILVPAAITGVHWGNRTVDVDLTQEQIRDAPEFDPNQTVDRVFEERYLGYYGYPIYW